METYRPCLEDVAKFVSSTSSVASPESKRVFYFLVERIEPLREIWEHLNRLLPGGDALRRVVELLICLESEMTSEAAYGTAVWMLEQVEETGQLWKALESMGADAGQVAHYPMYPVDVVELHQAVDRLLARDRWQTAEEVLDPVGDRGIDYKALVAILDARMARGDGDAERMDQVRRRLLREAAASRSKPLMVRIVEAD